MLGRTRAQWEQARAVYTASEILQQPGCWRKTLDILKENRDRLSRFISYITDREQYNIVLAGAGTSEFVGNAACPALSKKFGFRIRSHGTTDIVAAPEKYLSPDIPTLLVSFARSGNSPESAGAVAAADSVCKEVRHLFITCNKDGALAKMAGTSASCCRRRRTTRALP